MECRNTCIILAGDEVSKLAHGTLVEGKFDALGERGTASSGVASILRSRLLFLSPIEESLEQHLDALSSINEFLTGSRDASLMADSWFILLSELYKIEVLPVTIMKLLPPVDDETPCVEGKKLFSKSKDLRSVQTKENQRWRSEALSYSIFSSSISISSFPAALTSSLSSRGLFTGLATHLETFF